MKKIKKSFDWTIVTPVELYLEEGTPKMKCLEPMKLEGKDLTQERILKEIRLMYGKEANYSIMNLEQITETYVMDAEVFMANATKLI